MIKKIIPLIIITILLLTTLSGIVHSEQTNDYSITLIYKFQNPIIKKIEVNGEIFDYIQINGMSNSATPGEPSIPVKSANILLPYNTKIKNINVTYSKKTCLGLGFNLKPEGDFGTYSNIKLPLKIDINKEIYNSDELYPGRLYNNGGVHFFRGFNILVLGLFPVQYIPSTGELFFYEQLKVEIELEKDENISPLFRNLLNDKHEVMDKVDNPDIAETYFQGCDIKSIGVKSENDLMVIITSQTLKSGFTPLVERHQQDGLNVIFKTVEDIYNEYSGRDKPEKIRNYIKDAYNDLKISYVLFGGDSDVLPVRYLFDIYSGPDNRILSDLYYADLDGNYNYDGDDLWGEDYDGPNGNPLDIYADVYVGRACVSNSEDVNTFVTKTIDYMDYDIKDKFLRSVLMAGEYGYYATGGDSLDLLIDECNSFEPHTKGIPSNKFYINKLYDSSWRWILYKEGWPVSEVISYINKNMHFINHVGHANNGRLMKIEIDDVKDIKNDKYCFIQSVGCFAGAFDTSAGECIAEHLLIKSQHGAFAGIFCTNYGIAGATCDTPQVRLIRYFWDAVFDHDIRCIGRAYHKSKEDGIFKIKSELEDNVVGSWTRCAIFTQNLFGDPAVCLKIPEGDKEDKKDDEVKSLHYYRLNNLFIKLKPIFERISSYQIFLKNLIINFIKEKITAKIY